MEHLIKEALAEEAAEVAFPADAWQRQAGLLAEAGLIGGAAPVVQPRRARWGWLRQAATAAALLVLAVGAIGLQPFRSVSQSFRPGAHGTVRPPTWGVEGGHLRLPEAQSVVQMRVLNRLGLYQTVTADGFAGAPSWKMLRGWLEQGEVLGQLESWAPMDNSTTPPLYLQVDALTFTLQPGNSCYGVYDPTECYTIVGLPDGGAALVVQRDLSYWLDGQLWESSTDWTSTKFEPAGEYPTAAGEAIAAAQAHFASFGRSDLVAEGAFRRLRYVLEGDSHEGWRITAHPAWLVVLKEPDGGKGIGTIVLPDDLNSSLSPFQVGSSFYEEGRMPDELRIGVRNGVSGPFYIGSAEVAAALQSTAHQRWARPDPRAGALITKLLQWLGSAEVIQDPVPTEEEVAETSLQLELRDGRKIWFAQHTACDGSPVQPDCPFLVGGDGRNTALVRQPDLWRLLSGRLSQVLLDTSFPSGQRMEWTGSLTLNEAGVRARIEADPSVAAAGLRIEAIDVESRYVLRQGSDRKWQIDQSPMWVVHLSPTDRSVTRGEIRVFDDQTSAMLWQSVTTVN